MNNVQLPAAMEDDVSGPHESVHSTVSESSILLNAQHYCATVYDPDMLAALFASESPRVATLIARLTPAQRVVQALEHVCWCEQQGQACSLDTVLADWWHHIACVEQTEIKPHNVPALSQSTELGLQ